MPVVKLTQRLVDDLVNAEPPARDEFYWSDRVKGFGIKRQAQSGRCAYVIQWRDPSTGKSSRMRIADAAKVKLDAARGLVSDAFVKIAAGQNPLKARQERRKAKTFREVIDAYRSSRAWRDKAPSTRVGDNSRIDTFLLPAIGDLQTHEITLQRLKRLYSDLTDPLKAAELAAKAGRTKKVERGGETGARRTMRLVKGIMTWAFDEGDLTDNPAADLKLGSDAEREEGPTEEAYERLWIAIEKLRAAAETVTMRKACDIVALLTLTGARRSEIVGLRWRHLDLDQRRIQLGALEHKTGRKTGKARLISLSDDAVAILAGYQRPTEASAEDLIFEGLVKGRPVALQTPWERIAKEAKLPASITLHSLRHGIGSALAMGGRTERQIAEVLGHRQSTTTRRYTHFADRAREALAQEAASLVRPKKLRKVE